MNNILNLDNTETGGNAPHTVRRFIVDRYDNSFRLAEGITELVRGRIYNARQNYIELYLQENYVEV